MRVNHTYGRGGALAYLAAYDIHRAEIFGRCEQTTGIVPFMKLVEQVMTSEPYAGAKRVFFIVDNGSSHIVQRKVVSLNDFTDLDVVRNRLRAFEDRYNAAAQPFQWKFTTTDLDDLPPVLDRHTATDRQEESTAVAA